MSRQDFKDTKRAFKDSANTLRDTLQEFHDVHDIKGKQAISKRAKAEITQAEKKVGTISLLSIIVELLLLIIFSFYLQIKELEGSFRLLD